MLPIPTFWLPTHRFWDEVISPLVAMPTGDLCPRVRLLGFQGVFWGFKSQTRMERFPVPPCLNMLPILLYCPLTCVSKEPSWKTVSSQSPSMPLLLTFPSVYLNGPSWVIASRKGVSWMQGPDHLVPILFLSCPSYSPQQPEWMGFPSLQRAVFIMNHVCL